MFDRERTNDTVDSGSEPVLKTELLFVTKQSRSDDHEEEDGF